MNNNSLNSDIVMDYLKTLSPTAYISIINCTIDDVYNDGYVKNDYNKDANEYLRIIRHIIR